MKQFFALFLLATLAVSGDRASAQANVTENQSNYVYVDALLGSDGNSGALLSPFKTVQAAVNKANALNQQGVGVKLIVNPGTYREYVNIGNYNATGAALTLQAAVTGTAVIAGSDVLTGWSQAGAIYSRGWTWDTTPCPIPSGWPTNFAPIALHNEMVFVNGTPLTQISTFNDLRPGTFFINNQYSVIHIDPPAGTNMQTAVVEAAVRPSTLSVQGRSNVVIRGMVFEHAANCINTSGASVSGSTNVLVDSIQARWNNWGGFGIFSSNYVTMKNSVGSYNGGVGFQATRDQYALFSFNESDYNNWRGAQAALYDWASGGFKLFQMRDTTVNNQFSYNNQAQGLWFDTDNRNIIISNTTLAGNEKAALQIERNEGPVTLQNSILCSSAQGVNVLTTQHLTIQNNTFYNNSGTNKYEAEIFLGGTAGGIYIEDWQTGLWYDLFTTGMVLSGNTFEDAAGGQLLFGTYLGGNDWTQFATTLNAYSNTWYDPATSNSFKIVNGQVVGMGAWQSAVQTDYNSRWQPPAFAASLGCNVPAPSYPDFAANTDSSNYTMVAGQAVATIRVNSFGYGPVTLQAKGTPAGVSATFSQQTLTSGTATLTFTATSTAAVQYVPITLYATSGSRVHSVTFYLQVYPL
jgi:hypothetical protein